MRNRFDAQLHSLDEQLTHMGERDRESDTGA